MSESIQPILWCVEVSDNWGSQDPMLSDLKQLMKKEKNSHNYVFQNIIKIDSTYAAK